jgi:uncharacterized membrane protein
MAPLNGEHFTNYISLANQGKGFQFSNSHVLVNAQNVVAAISEPQERVTTGSFDPWFGHKQLSNSMRKGYNPMALLR